jgi:hypothetical protein
MLRFAVFSPRARLAGSGSAETTGRLIVIRFS